MTEITFVAEHDECYVNFDETPVANVVPSDIYIYRHSPLREREIEGNEWLAGKNPLFVHASNPAAVYPILRAEYLVSGEDEQVIKALELP